jgi:hypothetical protein
MLFTILLIFHGWSVAVSNIFVGAEAPCLAVSYRGYSWQAFL